MGRSADLAAAGADFSLAHRPSAAVTNLIFPFGKAMFQADPLVKDKAIPFPKAGVGGDLLQIV